jgi:hypothetical protein
MNPKKILTVLAILILSTGIFTPIMFTPVMAADPADWYTEVEGVLDSDSYVLYPYRNQSIKFGLSKFGEMINNNTKVGMEYAGERDPFAAPPGPDLDMGKLPPKVWINGWYIDIIYNHSSAVWGERRLWAGALFGDLSSYGKNWIRVDNDLNSQDSVIYEYQETFEMAGVEVDENGDLPPGGPPYDISVLTTGGRKTNGTATTEPIQVLYDGPRRYVAKLVNHIFDYNEIADDRIHLVDVVFTIIFNKVKKEVIILKDVKIVEQAKYVIKPLTIGIESEGNMYVPFGMLVQLSNREEWDLGDAPGYESYIHYWTQGTGPEDGDANGLKTCYNRNWTMLPTLPDDYREIYKGNSEDGSAHGLMPQVGLPATYDVAQVISNDKKYVSWVAHWPSTSDWSVDSGGGRRDLWWRRMLGDDPHDIDAFIDDEPFLAPLTIGEWDFLLSDMERNLDHDVYANTQFRGVSVYGITDLNDGTDDDFAGSPGNNLDTELLYQLDQIFMPWDLEKVVHKETKSWVQFDYGPEIVLEHYPVVDVSDEAWDDYCVFSERVLDMATGELLIRRVDYNITVGMDGVGVITDLEEDVYYKVLYDTRPQLDIDYYRQENNTIWTDPLGVSHGVVSENVQYYWLYQPIDTHLKNYTISHNTTRLGAFREEFFKVYRGEVHSSWDVPFNTTVELYNDTVANEYLGTMLINGTFRYNISASHDKNVTKPLEGETLHVEWMKHRIFADIQYQHIANSTGQFDIGYNNTYFKNDIDEFLRGRYEWTVVGRDAYSVDSMGAAFVTAAFKNKQVEIGMIGQDMEEEFLPAFAPWVMRKLGPGTEYVDYRDELKRAHLKDDWCTTWPVSSSNMIFIGGAEPMVNLGTYLFNDFTDAFSDFTGEFTAPHDSPMAYKIMALTCWNKHTYESSEDMGYAVIGTYKDINGTVGLNIYGHWGRDTYYASKFFHDDIIYELQEFPCGATSIVVEIDYSEDMKHPTFNIVEVLGTISEHEEWLDEYCGNIIHKGGLHDPPPENLS